MQSRDEILAQIRAASEEAAGPYLTYARFRELSGIAMSRIYRHFDSWTDACLAAGVKPGEASPTNLTPNYSKGKMHAVAELKRVARYLGAGTLSKARYDAQNPEVKACTVARLWGGWINAVEAAGLAAHRNYHPEIPLHDLTSEFLAVLREIRAVPTVNQLTRRSQHSKNTFTRKFGSFTAFKRAAIRSLLNEGGLPEETRLLLEGHLAALPAKRVPTQADVPPHRSGRHLGFRAFAFAPTYEAEVASMFASVADDLGFEIVCQREAFPDCEARRRAPTGRASYRKCLIEFEFQSREFRKHGHPADGCDLVVCWEHNWPDCPVEVLELRLAIRDLGGWK